MHVATTYFEERMIEAAPLWAASMSSSYEVEFLRAFDEHSDALFRHACFRLSNREKAVDITQETYLKAWDYARSGKEVRQWKSFLYRVLNNLIIDEYRRIKDESLDAMVEEDTHHANDLLAIGGRSEKEDALHDELLIEKIRTFIPKLPSGLRDALTLRYVDGFSPAEVAEYLGVSENVASVRIHRAVVRLRELCASIDTL